MIGISPTAFYPFDKVNRTILINLPYTKFMDAFVEVLVKLKRFHHIYYKTPTENTLPSNSVILNKKAYVL